MPAETDDFAPSQGVDVTIGVILTVCSVVGITTNMIAFMHFAWRKSRNPNSLFFTRTYCVISFVDCLISLKHFPVIQSMFHSRGFEDGVEVNLLFRNDFFCSAWFMITMCTIMVSILCVLMLAMFRYILIKYPNVRIHWTPPWVPPLIWTAILLIIMASIEAADLVAITYNKDKGVCVMYGSLPEFDFNNITDHTMYEKQMMERDLNKKIAWSATMAAPIPLIMICFVLSLRHLKLAKVRASNTRGGHKAHTAASFTVVIFTLVYVICNFPMLIYLIYMKTVTSSTLKDWEEKADLVGINRPEYVIDNDTFYYKLYYNHLVKDVYSYFERYYAWVAVFDLPTALNSALNPMIYYWRMKPFRVFIHQGIRDVSSSTGQSQSHLDTTAKTKPTRLSVVTMPTLRFGAKTDDKKLVPLKTVSSAVPPRALDYRNEKSSGEKGPTKIRFEEDEVLENACAGSDHASGDNVLNSNAND